MFWTILLVMFFAYQDFAFKTVYDAVDRFRVGSCENLKHWDAKCRNLKDMIDRSTFRALETVAGTQLDFFKRQIDSWCSNSKSVHHIFYHGFKCLWSELSIQNVLRRSRLLVCNTVVHFLELDLDLKVLTSIFSWNQMSKKSVGTRTLGRLNSWILK